MTGVSDTVDSAQRVTLEAAPAPFRRCVLCRCHPCQCHVSALTARWAFFKPCRCPLLEPRRAHAGEHRPHEAAAPRNKDVETTTPTNSHAACHHALDLSHTRQLTTTPRVVTQTGCQVAATTRSPSHCPRPSSEAGHSLYRAGGPRALYFCSARPGRSRERTAHAHALGSPAARLACHSRHAPAESSRPRFPFRTRPWAERRARECSRRPLRRRSGGRV